MPPSTPSTTMICSTPRPTTDITVSRISRPGIDIHASTKRCTVRSSHPPMKPEMPPTTSATSTLTAVAAKPTPRVRRAP